MGQYFETARRRIRHINWKFEDKFRPSHEVLAREWFRRINKFFDECKFRPKGRRAMFDILDYVGVDLPIDISKTGTELDRIKGPAYFISTMYLGWSYLVDQEELLALQFHDLYEPILKMYERGGVIYRHHQDLIFGNTPFLLDISRYADRFSSFDISDEALEDYDRKKYYQIINRLLEKYSLSLNEEEKIAFYPKNTKLPACNKQIDHDQGRTSKVSLE